jgi:hypothetical protein
VQAQGNDLEVPKDHTPIDASAFDSLEPIKINLPKKVKGNKCPAKMQFRQDDLVTFVYRRWVVSLGTPSSAKLKRVGCGITILRVVICVN